jgi:hypothetical protein
MDEEESRASWIHTKEVYQISIPNLSERVPACQYSTYTDLRKPAYPRKGEPYGRIGEWLIASFCSIKAYLSKSENNTRRTISLI